MNEAGDRDRAIGPGSRGPVEPPGLLRVVTLPWLVLYGLGSTVGAGIYVLTGVVAGRAGLLSPVAFALAAAFALLTALSFAELSARFPRAGGALVYVKEGTGSPTLSVAVGLLTALAGVVSAATVCLGFVGYLSALAAFPSAWALVFVVLGIGGLAAWGVRESVLAAGLVTLIEIAGLLAILGFGLVHLAGAGLAGGALGTNAAGGSPIATPIGMSGLGPSVAGAWVVLSSTVLCFYAYLGFEDMVNVAEEVRDVRRSLPRAILWTIGISTALYVSVATIAILVVPPGELARHPAPLSLVFERSGGSPAALSLVALAAMLNGALVQMIMASRVLYSLSREGALPAWLGRVHPRRRTPLAATLIVTAAVALLAAALPLEGLAAATASVALAVFVLANFALWLILRREPAATRRAAGAVPIFVPVLGGLTSLGLLVVELLRRLVSLGHAP